MLFISMNNWMQQESPRCIICGAPLVNVMNGLYDIHLGIDRLFSIAECKTCGIEQSVPTLTPEELQQLYEKYYNLGEESPAGYWRYRERFYASPAYRLWIFIDGDICFHLKRGTGRLLDVGCNEGRGLLFYRKNGFAAEGLEVNRKAAALARSLGFEVYGGQIDDFVPSEDYDVVVLSNVLEHALDPKAMLHHVRRLLKPGGEVWISCPNRKSWLRRLFGKSWVNWHVPFHICHFSRASLSNLISQQGFRSREIKNETPALWVSQSIIGALFARRGQKTMLLRNPFVIAAMTAAIRGVLFPALWIGNRLGMGDCLAVTAAKVNLDEDSSILH